MGRWVSVALGCAVIAIAGGHSVLRGQQAANATATPACNPQETASLKARLNDWGGLGRYASDDASLPPPSSPDQRVVFLGDSITDAWGRLPDTGTFFLNKPYLNRGIGGQTTPQMLVRFEQDVVSLHPAVVLINGGTNDIAGNTGPTTPESIENNYRAMTQLARASNIKVILSSITPADHYPWKPGVQPATEIRQLNAWMQKFCATGACTYLDYYSSMTDANGAMLPGYSKDGVHPTAKGYAVMAPLAEQAIAKVLGGSARKQASSAGQS